MDLFNPKTWTDGWDVVVNARHIVIPLLAAVGYAAWWVRGTLVDKPKIDGLEQRLALAKEQQSPLTEQLADVKVEVALLKRQLENSGADRAILNTVYHTEGIIDRAASSNTQLGNTISDVGRITRIRIPKG
jgi:hypothetical protein